MNDEDKKAKVENEETKADSSVHNEPDKKAAKEERPVGEEKLSEEQMAKIEKNPDLEDPRLYSPLQEPDRPNPSLRTHEESEQEEPEEPPPPKE